MHFSQCKIPRLSSFNHLFKELRGICAYPGTWCMCMYSLSPSPHTVDWYISLLWHLEGLFWDRKKKNDRNHGLCYNISTWAASPDVLPQITSPCLCLQVLTYMNDLAQSNGKHLDPKHDHYLNLTKGFSRLVASTSTYLCFHIQT